MRLIIISGRSGSGKTVALNALEDIGYYCIDNLPISMLSGLEQELISNHPNIALSIDVRNSTNELVEVRGAIDTLKKYIKKINIIYLDADDNTILKRFSETRRKHPLANEQITLKEAIQLEHQLLNSIATLADTTLDTSNLNHHMLHQIIRDRANIYPPSKGNLLLLLQSFGFKKGLPPDADYVFDVRCLPNPHWQPQLRHLTGRDQPVIEFLGQQTLATSMLNDISNFISRWVPSFSQDNRRYLTIAVGCTGGQHRSVYFIEQLAKHGSLMQNNNVDVQIRHRELG